MFNFDFIKEEKDIRKFFIIFYSIGILGIVIPYTRNIFIFLTPFALLISFVSIVFFHAEKFNLKTILIFVSIFLFGFFIEVLGVKTGLIFGNYYYGKGFGLKFLGTPLMIGINWLLLVYCTSAIFVNLQIHAFLKVLFSSFLMVIYDLILEPVAPDLQMWYFNGSKVPLKNYISWFILAFLFHSLIKLTGTKTSNKIAPLIFYCQLCFFVILLLFFILIK